MYKVYVGCLPASCTAEQLAEFFSQHGQILDMKVSRKAGSKLCSGNGTFSCVDQQTYDALVATREFDFNGRVIFCEGKLSGEQLLQKNLTLSRRRIFVSNLPSSATDQDIEDSMRGFGAVQNGYRIKTLSNKPRPFGFVTFFDETSAENAIETGFVLLYDQFVYISPFKKNSPPRKGTEVKENCESGCQGTVQTQKSVQTTTPTSLEGGVITHTWLSATNNSNPRSMKVRHDIKPTLVRYNYGWLGFDHGDSQVRFNVHIPHELLMPIPRSSRRIKL